VNESPCPVRRRGSIAIIVCLLFVLVGCGGDDGEKDPTPTPDRSATAAALAIAAGPSPTPLPTPSPSYGEVVWATAVDAQTKEPVSQVDTFSTGAETIYAAILVRNLPPNTVLTADWTYNATSLDGLTTSAELVSGTDQDWVEFHLTRSDEPWPDGTYAISISVDGEVIASAEVGVENR
jgi:hypothetical protein